MRRITRGAAVRLIVLLAALGCLASARADLQLGKDPMKTWDLGHFTIDVPRDWRRWETDDGLLQFTTTGPDGLRRTISVCEMELESIPALLVDDALIADYYDFMMATREPEMKPDTAAWEQMILDGEPALLVTYQKPGDSWNYVEVFYLPKHTNIVLYFCYGEAAGSMARAREQAISFFLTVWHK